MMVLEDDEWHHYGVLEALLGQVFNESIQNAYNHDSVRYFQCCWVWGMQIWRVVSGIAYHPKAISPSRRT